MFQIIIKKIFNFIENFYLLLFIFFNFLFFLIFFNQYDIRMLNLHFCFFILSTFVLRFLSIDFDNSISVFELNLFFLYNNFSILFFIFFLLFHSDIVFIEHISHFFIKIDQILNPKLKFILIIFSLSFSSLVCLTAKRNNVSGVSYYTWNKYLKRCTLVFNRRTYILRRAVFEFIKVMLSLSFLLYFLLRFSLEFPRIFFLSLLVYYFLLFVIFLCFFTIVLFYFYYTFFWCRIQDKLNNKYNDTKYERIYEEKN